MLSQLRSLFPYATLAVGLVTFPAQARLPILEPCDISDPSSSCNGPSDPCESSNPPSWCDGSTDPDPEPNQEPVGHLDQVIRWPGGVRVRGWSYDPDYATSANRVKFRSGAYLWFTSTVANLYRPDVGAAHPSAGNHHGFDHVMSVGYGTHNICAYASDYDGTTYDAFLGCHSIDVNPAPFGWLDVVERRPGGLWVKGWAIDPDTTQPALVGMTSSMWPSSQYMAAQQSRPDVGAAHPGYGDLHGFDHILETTPGNHSICFKAIKANWSTPETQFACRDIVINSDPVGSLDSMQSTGSVVRVGGWSLDQDVGTPIDVEIFQGGTVVRTVTANQTRTDVGNAYPGYGNEHGFSAEFPASTAKGTHTVCARGINVGAGYSHTFGCKSYTVNGPPAAPVIMNFSSRTHTGFHITWTDTANDETGFRVEKWVGGSWTFLANTAPVTYGTKTVIETGLTPDTEYCYRVRAFNAYGDSDWLQGCGKTTLPPIAAPTGLVVTGTTTKLHHRVLDGQRHR